ncbi:MAG: NADH-quinone oxidoreductase subunit L [Planctomycetota bacterium]
METISWFWWIPGLPLVGSIICGCLHFLTLRARRSAGAPQDATLVGPSSIAPFVAIAAMAGAFALSLMGFFMLRGSETTSFESPAWDWIDTGDFVISVSMVLDRLSSVMTLVVTGVGMLIHIYAAGYMKGDPGYGKFFAFLNLFVTMMLMLVLSSNLVGLFVGWEGVGLCSYLLIGFWYQKGWPAEAAQKAFVVNRIGDAFFLIGMFMLVGLAGDLSLAGGPLDMSSLGAAISTLMEQPGNSTQLAIAALMLFGGACGKSAQLPLFVWLPDAMAGPTPVSALIHAATMVTSGIYMIVRLNPLFAASPSVLFVIGAVGAATAFIAGSTAIFQRDLKKVLAYSTVSQLGYMFLGLGTGAWAAAIFHLVTHAFFKALLFLGAGSVIHGMHDEQDMYRMGGLRKKMPVTFITFVAGAAALSGLPLLSGFFSKDEILAHTFAHGGAYWMLWIVGLLTAAMTAYYSWRMVALTFFGEGRYDPEQVHPHESPKSMTMPLIVLAVLSIGGGLLGLPAVFNVAHALGTWLEPVTAPGTALLASAGAAAHHLSHTAEWALLGLGSLIAFVFAHKGFHAHRNGTANDEALAASRPEVARVLGNAWGIDRFYNDVIVQGVKLGGFLIAVVVDQFAIDGIVNGCATVAKSAGNRVRRFTDGSITTYGLWMGGVTAMIAFVWMWMGGAR